MSFYESMSRVACIPSIQLMQADKNNAKCSNNNNNNNNNNTLNLYSAFQTKNKWINKKYNRIKK